MHRGQSAGEVFSISVDGEEWLFDPRPREDVEQGVSEDFHRRHIYVIDVTAPNGEIFGLTLPPGTEHTQFSDDQLIFMALGRLEMIRSGEFERRASGRGHRSSRPEPRWGRDL